MVEECASEYLGQEDNFDLLIYLLANNAPTLPLGSQNCLSLEFCSLGILPPPSLPPTQCLLLQPAGWLQACLLRTFCSDDHNSSTYLAFIPRSPSVNDSYTGYHAGACVSSFPAPSVVCSGTAPGCGAGAVFSPTAGCVVGVGAGAASVVAVFSFFFAHFGSLTH